MVLETFGNNIDIKSLSLEEPETVERAELDPAQYLTDEKWDTCKGMVLDGWRKNHIGTAVFLRLAANCYAIDRQTARQKLPLDQDDIAKLNDYMALDIDATPSAKTIQAQANYLMIRGSYFNGSPDLTGVKRIIAEEWGSAALATNLDVILNFADFLADLKILLPVQNYTTPEVWKFLAEHLQKFRSDQDWGWVASLAGSMRLIDPAGYEKIKLDSTELKGIHSQVLRDIGSGGLFNSGLARDVKILSAKEISFKSVPPELIMYETKEKRGSENQLPQTRSF